MTKSILYSLLRRFKISMPQPVSMSTVLPSDMRMECEYGNLPSFFPLTKKTLSVTNSISSCFILVDCVRSRHSIPVALSIVLRFSIIVKSTSELNRLDRAAHVTQSKVELERNKEQTRKWFQCAAKIVFRSCSSVAIGISARSPFRKMSNVDIKCVNDS